MMDDFDRANLITKIARDYWWPEADSLSLGDRLLIAALFRCYPDGIWTKEQCIKSKGIEDSSECSDCTECPTVNQVKKIIEPFEKELREVLTEIDKPLYAKVYIAKDPI